MKRAFLRVLAIGCDRMALKLSAMAQISHAELSLRQHDWAQLQVYHAMNAVLAPPAPDENRVVFLGDSITAHWDLASYFPGKPYINRGIAGQTTSQMLVRSRPDVIGLKPRIIVILAGTNDLAGNTGPMTLEMIQQNYASLAELAKFHQIQVVFGSVLPIHDYGATKISSNRTPARIQALNQWLQDYCTINDCRYLDYYSAMLDAQGWLQAELSPDGLHPNARGYAVMADLAAAALQQVVPARQPG